MVCSWTVWWHHLEHYLLLRRLHGSASRHAPLREIKHWRPNQGNLSSVACEWTYPSYASFVAASYGPCMCKKISFNDMFKTLFSDLFEYVVQSLLSNRAETVQATCQAAILTAACQTLNNKNRECACLTSSLQIRQALHARLASSLQIRQFPN